MRHPATRQRDSSSRHFGPSGASDFAWLGPGDCGGEWRLDELDGHHTASAELRNLSRYRDFAEIGRQEQAQAIP